MMIDHPNAATQVHQLQPTLNMGADLVPAGPVRRAVVFGGSNLVIRAGTANMKAALEFVRAYEAPNQDTLLSGLGSNPANRAGFSSAAEKIRSTKLLFNDVTLKMMPYGVNVPLIPQGSQIWNQTIPTMIQNVLTKAMSPKQAAASAESQIQQIMG
jgi:multiple sugar transport system substrate-binding protein